MSLNHVGIYVRKSSQKQSELTLPAQERLIRDFLAREQIPAQSVVVYQDILSGRRPDRAGYQQMLADARAGRLQMVVFHKINRFARDTSEGLYAVQELRSYGVTVRVVDIPSLDLTRPEGMLIFTLMLGQGQYEIENLGSEAQKGMREKLARGGWVFRAPDGYRNLREEIAPRKFRSWVAVDRHRAAIIKLMFRWYAMGTLTLVQIADRLNRLDEMRTSQGKTGCAARKGRPWHSQRIWGILNNPFYCGQITVASWGYQGQGIHQPIVSPLLYQQVQEVLAAHERSSGNRHCYLLQQRIWMDHHPLRCTTVTKKNQTYQYYYRQEGTNRTYFEADAINQQVVAMLRERLAALGSQPDVHIGEIVSAAAQQRRIFIAERSNDIRQARERVLSLGGWGRFTRSEIEAQLNQLEYEQRLLDAEREQMRQVFQQQSGSMDGIRTVIRTIQAWETASVTDQLHVVAEVIDRVVINEAALISRIWWQPLWQTIWYAYGWSEHTVNS